MAVNTKIQVRRGYSTGYSGAAIGGLTVSGNTWAAGSLLSQGEIGFEIDTGKFKIGTDGTTGWASLPYAGGSAISGISGICSTYDSTANAYTLSSIINPSGSGISINYIECGGTGSGSIANISLSNRLQNVSNLTSSGIIVSTSSTGINVIGLSSGNNIFIQNPSGLSGNSFANPIISLSDNITLSGVTTNNFNTISGVVTNRLSVSGALTLNGRDITTNLEAVPNTNTANFNLSVGSVTNVGSNGGPSYYGTYDQGGNVREIFSLSGNTTNVGMRGGNFASWASDDNLNKSFRNATQIPSGFGPGFGFRLSSRANIGKLYPLTLTGSSTGIATSGSVVHGFQIGDPIKFVNDFGLPSPLATGTTYYILGTGSSTFSVSTSVGGSAVTIGSAGTSTTAAYITYDYGSFVRVENSGNAADSTSYGSVSYNYRIGKFEITNDEYAEFLNSAARDDHDSGSSYYSASVDRSLYEPMMETEVPNNGIARSSAFPDYYYSALRGMNKKPVVFVSYIDAARYSNWLHNGKPVSARYRLCLPVTNGGITTVIFNNHGFVNGDLITFNCADGGSFTAGGSNIVKDTVYRVANSQTNSFDVVTNPGGANVTFAGTGSFFVRKYYDKATYLDSGAYTLNLPQGSAVAKNAAARYWIPTENEWYKAAYYDPNKGGLGVTGYWTYPTRSDTMPSGVTADAYGNGTYNPGGTIPSHYHSSYDVTDFVDRVDNILVNGSGTAAVYNPVSGVIAINVTGIPLSRVTDVAATSTEVNYLSGIVLGSGKASTVVALDSNRSISGIQTLSAATGIFTSGSFSGSSSADSATTLSVGGTGVSLSGHKHYYTAGQGFVDIPNFCSGVADCVNTTLTVSTGLRGDFSSNNLQLALSGQAATLHSFTGVGLLTRTSGPDNNGVFAARSLASGSNIFISNVDGVNGDPTVFLSSSLTGLTSVTSTDLRVLNIASTAGNSSITINSDVTITGNVIVSNLTVTGTTTTVNSTSITVNDPTISLGGTGIITNDGLDRGIEFRYPSGATPVSATGFFGYDLSAGEFVLLKSVTKNPDNTYDTNRVSGILNVGGLFTYGSLTSNDIAINSATSSRLAVFDSTKKLVSTGVPTLLEISYVSGVTGNIQTQFDGKVPTTRSITPGSGLDGSSALDFSSDRTLNIGQGYGITVNANTIEVNSNVFVVATGTTTISGVKTFISAPVFSGGLVSSGNPDLKLTSAGTTIYGFAVFDNDPTSNAQSLKVRSTGNIISDIGSTGTIANRLVLRDSNGSFSASTILATGFVGYGGGVTGLYANNLSSGTVPSGRLSGNYNISILGNAATVSNGVYTGRTINTTSGIVGGGNLGSDLNLGAVAGSGITVNSAGIHASNGSGIVITAGGINVSSTSGIVTTSTSIRVVGGSGITVNAGGFHVASTSGIVTDTNGISAVAGTGITVNAGGIHISTATVVTTSGSQNVSGIKTFYNQPIFNSGIISSGTFNVQAAAANSTSGFAVFDTSPVGTGQNLLFRTLGQIRTDLGASTNTSSTLVLRDSNGGFNAGSITGTTFIGSGNQLTDVSAYNLRVTGINISSATNSIVMITGNGTGIRDMFIDTNLGYDAISDRLILSSITGNLSLTYMGVSNISSFSSTSISGIGNSAYLFNFIIDGGTP